MLGKDYRLSSAGTMQRLLLRVARAGWCVAKDFLLCFVIGFPKIISEEQPS